MEFNSSTGEDGQPQERLNPVIGRRIVGYFQIAQHLPSEDLEPNHPLNPIRNLLGDKPITQDDMDEFLENLGRGRLGDLSKAFFKGIVGPRSPVALDETTKTENLREINSDQELDDIMFEFKESSEHSIYPESHPSNIDFFRKTFLINAQWLGATELQEASLKFERFLELYFGSEVLAYSKQFSILQTMARKKYRWEARHKDFYARLSSSPPPRKHRTFIGSGPPDARSRYSSTPPQNPTETRSSPTNPDPKGYYEVLGLDPSVRGLPYDKFNKILRDAWRQAVKETHTDVGGDNADIVRVNVAKTFLKDPQRRQNYGR